MPSDFYLIGSSSDPTAGSGGGWSSSSGRGGGRIVLECIECPINLYGVLSSDGTAATCTNGQCGAGSGGSVSILALSLTGNGTITANGGNTTGLYRSVGAGGGGRIYVNARQSSSESIMASMKFIACGGYGNSSIMDTYGAAGTILINAETSVLEVKNIPYSSSQATTMVSSFPAVNAFIAGAGAAIYAPHINISSTQQNCTSSNLCSLLFARNASVVGDIKLPAGTAH